MRYLIWGYYGYGNLGDELMLKIIVENILKHDPNPIIYARCFNTPGEKNVIPFPVDKSRIRIPFLDIIVYIFKTWRMIAKTDIIILGGGTVFLDKGRHNISMLLLAIAVFFAKLTGKKFYIIGAGIDILTFPINIIYLKYILNSSDYTCLRDNFSYTMARYLTKKENVFRSSDIVFDESFINLLTKDNQHERKYIILSLTDYYKTWHSIKKRRLLIEKSCEFIKMLLEKFSNRYRILLCAFQRSIGDRDYEFLEEIKNLIIQKNSGYAERIKLEHIVDEEEACEFFSSAVLIISMRYHALVLSAIFKRPFLGIDIEMKIREICLEFDMPFINIDDFLKKKYNSSGIEKLLLSNISEEKLTRQIEMARVNFEWLH